MLGIFCIPSINAVKNTVIKNNIKYSTITTISRLVSGFFLIFILARFLSLEDFGNFTYSLVLANLLVLIIDYGYNLKLSKDTSNNINNISLLTWSTFKVKIFLTLFVAIILIVLFLLNYPNNNLFLLISILTFSSAFNSIANHFLIPYRSIDKFDIETKFAFINNIILFITVFITTYLFKDIILIALSFLFVKIFYCTYTIKKFIGDYGFKNVNINLKSELKGGLPYAIHIGVGAILLNIDTVILKEFVSDAQIGLYQAGMRALAASTIGLGILNSVLIPKLSHLINNRKKLIALSTKINFISIFLGGFIAIFINIFSNQLIYIVYGDKFLELSKYVFNFSIIIFLRYSTILYGAILTISNLQKVRTYTVSIALIFIIISDLIIIPLYKLDGALYILIIAHLIILITYYIYSYRSFKTSFLNYNYAK
tara:strand:+ start:10646 stop:11926 length:1281 start_codon:yes stop_codon:yes gene_type:complete